MVIPFFYLNVLLLLFLVITAIETRLKRPVVPKTFVIQKTPPLLLAGIVFVFFFLTLALVLYASDLFVSWYLHGSLTVLIIGHALWLTRNRSVLIKGIFLIPALMILAARYLAPSETTHNVLLLTGIVWIGTFLIELGLLTLRRFIILSIFWFLYDIIFVWFTTTAQTLVDRTTILGLPLAIIAGKSFIGSGDLLWANLLVSLIAKKKWQMITIVVLIVSNLVLGLYDYLQGNEGLFPLLVLWVPIGIVLLHLSSQLVVNSRTSKDKSNNHYTN